MTRVLVVEDNADLAYGLRNNLEIEGYDVELASDGPQGLTRARARPPDLMLLDVMLPRRNGFEVCQTIRESPELNQVKIVMLTAKGRETEITKGLALGADAYITKPFATRELLETVGRLLGT
jgi:DNA-binding response OmpR family regulator